MKRGAVAVLASGAIALAIGTPAWGQPVEPARPASAVSRAATSGPVGRVPAPDLVASPPDVYELSIAGTDAGRVHVAATPEEVWVERQALERAGLRPGVGSQLDLDGISYVGLVSLRRELGYELDESNAILRLTSRATHLVAPSRLGVAVASRLGTSRAPSPDAIVGTTEVGRTRVLFQFNRNTFEQPLLWLGPLSAVVIPSTSHDNVRVESQHWVSNLGLVDSSVDLQTTGGPVTASRGFLGLSGVAVGASRINVWVGDRPLATTGLDLGVSALQQPAVGVRGGELDVTLGAARLHAFGGRTTVTGGYFAESVLTSDQAVFGARVSGQRGRGLRFAAGVLRTDGSDARDTMTPATATALTASTVFEPNTRVRLTADLSVARYVATSDGPEPTPARLDTSYVLAGRFTGKRGRGEIDWVRLGPAYLPLTFTRTGDRQGFLGSGDYRIAGRTQIDGTAQRWSTNVGHWSAVPRYDLYTALFGVRHALTDATSFGGRIGLSGIDRTPRAPEASSKSRTLNADWAHRRGSLNLAARLSDILVRQEHLAEQETWRRRLDFDVRWAWAHGASLGGTIGLLRQRIDGIAQSTLAGGLSGTWSPGPRASFYSELTWNQEFAGLAALKVDTLSASAGVDVSLGRGLRLRANGRAIRDVSVLAWADERVLFVDGQGTLESHLLDRLQGRYQLTISLQKELSWGSRPAVRHTPGSAPTLPRNVGRIEGMVFSDLDADGRRGPAEIGVPGVVVRLDGLVSVPIDAAGRFAFDSVPAGTHALALDLRTVPASYDIGPRETMSVEIRKRGVEAVEIPLVPLGKIRGRVVVVDPISADTERRLRLVPAAAPRPLAGVLMQLDGDTRTTVTDHDGEFEFSGVVGGRHTVRVVTQSLPVEMQASSPEPIEVSLSAGQRLENIRIEVPANPAAPQRRLPAS